MRERIWIVIMISTLLGMGIPGTIHSQTDQICFPQTGFCIAGRFRQFWEQNGGLAVFGYPITPQRGEVVETRPFEVQWFERERFELHPDNPPPYDVLLGRLGAERLSQLGSDWFQFPKSEAMPNCRFFPETGHNVCGEFLAAWQANGVEFDGRRGSSAAESLALFGLPLSDLETETIEGKQYTVQWFERARFELHTELSPPYRVLLTLLGRQILDAGQSGSNPRLKISFSPEELKGFADVLRPYDISTNDINVDRTVTYALPQPNSVILQSAPLKALRQSNLGVVLGVLKAARPLPVASDLSAQLRPQIYLVVLQNGQPVFIPPYGDPLKPPVKLDVRQRSEKLDMPDTTVTNDLVCYAPDPASSLEQFCLDLSARLALGQEKANTIVNTMQASVSVLRDVGLLDKNEQIVFDRTIPAVEGKAAVEASQASLLAAPAAGLAPAGAQWEDRAFFATQQVTPTQLISGTLIGSLAVSLTVQLQSPPVTILPGAYAVRLVRSPQPAPNDWNARLEGVNGSRFLVPARIVQALGGQSSPDTALRSVCFTWFDVCIF